MRYFNGKPIELLAPAGNFEIFNSVVDSKCDAIYFGGQILNMRLIRKGFNFTNEELKQAIEIAHSKDKLVYITVNNLINNNEIEQAKEYLCYLNEIKPDALIVQDMAVYSLIKSMDLSLPLHASVMMNVHNLEMINQLDELGFTRVVLSREMDLDTVSDIHSKTNMELEYFTHGDMCVCHGAQCTYSGILFGMSSNRGRCLKPCRWGYKLALNGKQYPTKFPLAVKDLCLYEYLPEMIGSGITSFKLEGRMREKDAIVKLINIYGNALDKYINTPDEYNRKEDIDYLIEHRKRDLSTAYAFGKPGLSNINSRYEGTGKFYSTGKMFSTPTEEPNITEDRINEIKNIVQNIVPNNKMPKLSVRVQNVQQAITSINSGADIIYLAGDVYLPNTPFSVDDIKHITSIKGSSKIFLAFPRMMNQEQFDIYDKLLENDLNIDGLLVTNMGVIHRYRHLNLPIYGDYPLNIYNSLAANEYGHLGLSSYTVSIETPLTDLISLITTTILPSEVIVHGRQVVMYLEHDLYENTKVLKPESDYISKDILTLRTGKGEYLVYKDIYDRNHLLSSKELCLLPIINELINLGVDIIRIEDNYTDDDLEKVINAYKCAINGEIHNELVPVSSGYTLGALNHN